MKAKSLQNTLPSTPSKQNRVFDFVKLYQNSANPETSSDAPRQHEAHHSVSLNAKSESPKRERSPHRRKKSNRKSVDVSHIKADVEGLDNSTAGTSMNTPKNTSTPLQEGKSSKVKSIMKNSVINNDSTTDGDTESYSFKPKKRNKSVSFRLEDNEEVHNKKTKSNDSTDQTQNNTITKEHKEKKKDKKYSKHYGKENSLDANQSVEPHNVKQDKKSKKSLAKYEQPNNSDVTSDTNDNNQQNEHCDNTQGKKKNKKTREVKEPEIAETKEILTNNTDQQMPEKVKKSKKKKHQDKPETEVDNEEPVSKSRKESKPDVVEELEQLSIGDNPHTLTHLLDEMTVVDKEKRKKLKHKSNKSKKQKGGGEPLETSEEVQAKVKWMKRKWNKEDKTDKDNPEHTVIVQNLPLSLLLSYKKVLADHFVKYGLIKGVGVAELYTTVKEPVFSTSINFYSDGAAQQALSDECELEGRRLQLQRALPATATTAVVRSYAALAPAAVAAALHRAGRIRSIKHAVKGKHSMATFFVEFDGPAAVDAALELAADLKIGGKKVYISKYEVRTKKKNQKISNNEASDADQSDNS